MPPYIINLFIAYNMYVCMCVYAYAILIAFFVIIDFYISYIKEIGRKVIKKLREGR